MERDREKEKLKCGGCDREISPEEAAHDALNEGLNSLVCLATLSPLSIAHIMHLGLTYFMEQVYQCAPDREEAERMITETLNKIRKEQNNG